MLTRIRRFFAPPVFEDEEKMRVVRLLNTVLLAFLVTTVLIIAAIPVLYGPPTTSGDVFMLLSAAIMIVVIGGLLVLTRRGHLQVASVVLLSLIWAIITFWICTTVGISSDSSPSNYILIIVLAGLLLGGRAAIAFTLLSMLAVLGAFYAETSGLLTVPDGPLTVMDPILTLVPLALTGLLLHYAVNSMLGALERARKNERAQIEANRELRAVRGSLEQRVADRTRELARRSMQLQAAAEVGRTATSLRDLEALLLQVTRLISARFDFYHVGIFLLDEASADAGGETSTSSAESHVVLRATNSEGGRQMLAQGYKLKVGDQSIVGRVASTQEPRIALDVGQDAVHFETPLLPYTRSEMALPLIAGGRLLGVLDVQSMEEAAFTTEDVVVLQVLVDQVAVAIENARLFAQTQEALEAERRAYGEIGREAWTQMLRTQPDLGYLCDSQGTHAVEGEWRPEMVEASRTGQAVQGSVGRQDQDADIRRTFDRPSDGGPTVAIPIKIRDQVLGVVRLRKPEGAGEWTREEMGLMEVLTEQLSMALDGARLYQDTQRRAARDRLAGEVAARMRESLDVETVLKTAAQEVRQALKLPEVVIRLGTPPPSASTQHAGNRRLHRDTQHGKEVHP